MKQLTNKRCWNCKHHKFEAYGSDECRNPMMLKIISTDGIVKKEYPKAQDVRPSDGYHACPYLQSSLWFKIKLGVLSIRLWWFRIRYPEKLL